MASKPIVAQTKSGAEYGFATEAAAKKSLGDDVKIVRNQDGTVIEAAKPASTTKKASK